jgi:hypothetical protein
MLSAKQILAAQDRQTRTVHVPEWATDGDDVVLIGTMGALDYAELQDWIGNMGTEPETDEPDVVSCDTPDLDKEPPEKTYSNAETFELMVRWCIYTILDPKTQQTAFTSEQVRDLGRKSFVALERVYIAALELNRVTQDAAEAFEKNSEGTPGSASGGE